MILTIGGLVLLFIVALSFFNIRLGAALYLAYVILVPIYDVTLGGIHIGQNIIRTLLIISLIYDFKLRHHYKFSWKLFAPFIIYYIIEFVLIPFQSGTPLSWMYNSWRQSVMNTLFGTFFVYNVVSRYPNSIKLFRLSLILSILIAGIYGLYLTTTGGVNPYISLVILSTGTEQDVEDKLAYFMADDRMFGRISSVFLHPMSFGLFIGMSFVYVFSIRSKLKKWLLITLMTILALDALFCGVRSCIGGLVVAVAFYLVFSRNIKVGLITLIIGLLAYNVILQIPEMSDYLGSFADIHNTKSNINGSSIDQRMHQLDGCLNEISNNPLLGKGYDWNGYYHNKFGDHPVIYAFESLIFVVLCDNGFLGLLIWAFLIYLVIKNNHRSKLADKYVADAIFVFYISYSCITGEYGYMQYFLLFYICLIGENCLSDNNKVKVLNHI